MKLFDDISLIATELSVGIVPVIHIDGFKLYNSGYYVSQNYYYLEKYIIPRTNDALLKILAKAISCQSVLYYMSTASIYMSGIFWMGEHDLGVPEFIDISYFFENGKEYIIDNNTDIDNNLYVYRIITSFMGIEHSSNYIVGLQNISIDPTGIGMYNIPIASEADIELTTGKGSLYRTDEYGKIILKGLPFGIWNSRYKGPIEESKENAMRESIYNVTKYYDIIHGRIDDSITAGFDIIEDMSSTIRSINI